MARRKHKRPHGTGSISVRGGRAQLRWTENGVRRTKTVDLADYPAFLARANAGLEASPTTKPASKTLSDLAAIWLNSRSEMASNYDDRNRWKNHLEPSLGVMEPNQVDVPVLKALIITLKSKGLSKGTVRLCMALLSSLYGDLMEDGSARLNPVRFLSRKTRMNELTPDRDWKTTPWVKSAADIRRVYSVLRAQGGESVARAYIIGALAGLRTNEVRALRWDHIDWNKRLIHIKEQAGRRTGITKLLKDKESRFVPITDALYAYFTDFDYALEARDSLVCSDNGRHLDLHRMGEAMKTTLAELELPEMRWYDATRHTFASHWVMNGGTLEKLREMMGHSSVTVTERYAHLIPGQYTDIDRARVQVDAPERVLTN